MRRDISEKHPRGAHTRNQKASHLHQACACLLMYMCTCIVGTAFNVTVSSVTIRIYQKRATLSPPTMSRSEDSQAACKRLRDLLRGLVYAPAAVTTPPDAIKQVKKILRIGKPFEPLLVNPFTTVGVAPRSSSVLEVL